MDKLATSLKHKIEEFSIADLIGSLDVEEKARAKDVRGKKIDVGSSSVHVVQKNPQNFHKKKFKQELKQKNTTPFNNNNKKNKKKRNCFSYDKSGHDARDYEESKWKLKKKYANMVEVDGETSGYDNILPIVLSVCYSPDWWFDT